ncbi:MAG: TonB-dependent receptor [Bryobacterales bacterium]|nr:TonB-dependent receptor [Bryobacterales bacterium]
MKKFLQRTLFLPALVCLAWSVFSQPAAAQEARGRVQGVVSDTSGAVIAGARVSLRNDNTGVETVRQTNTSGQYLFDLVVAGTYTVTVEMEGFRRFAQQNILVQTRADVTVDARLDLGAVTETINVTEAPVAVKFNTTSMDLTLDTKMTNDLPIIHRNPFLLATLNPAVQIRSTTEQSPYHHWAANQMDVGGNTSQKNDVLIDGTPQLMGGKGSYVPPMDAVSEVNVQQNAVDAEFGHSAGGIFSVQMKSGTNDWHGTAYYFGRNPALNAVADRTTFRPNQVKNHVWGVMSQNPIKREKIFNFFAYESHNVREPRTMAMTLPTELERQGNFSQSFNPSGNMRQIFDPLTTQISGNTSTRIPFAGNLIPASRIDPTSALFMRDIWLPNGPGDNITRVNNFRENFPQKFDYWNLSNRTDWNINDNWRTYGRISRFHTLQDEPNFTNSPAQRIAGSARHTWQFAGDAVWTVNPTTVFNVRASYSSIVDSFDAPAGQIDEQRLASFWQNNPWYQLYLAELPVIYYPGLDVRGESTSQFGRDGFWFQEPKTWALQSKVSKQMGRHYIKVGGEFRQQRILAARPRPMGFRFDKNPTTDTIFSPNTRDRGDAWASFLLGTVDPGNSRISTIPMNRPIIDMWGLYIQDDFKVSQRVTLNLGLRWEYSTALRDPEDRLSRALDLTNPIPEFQGANAPVLPAAVTAIRRDQPVYNGAWQFTDSNNRGTWNAPRDIFLPRVGLAFRVNDRTALRFGYAQYVTPPDQAFDAGVNILGSTPYPGFEQTTNPLPILQGVPQAFLRDPYPTGSNPLIPAVGKSQGRYTNLGNSTTWWQPDWQNETNHRFNVSVQRQIWNQIVVDLTYFANIGRNAPRAFDLNLADPRYGFEYRAALNQAVPNPFFQVLPVDQFPGQLRNQRNVSVGSLLRPFPHYGALTVQGTPLSRTKYNSLQVQIQRPFAQGYNLIVGYNYNRGYSQEFYDNVDQFDRVVTYQNANIQIPRHKFTLGSIYQFPFGKGRRFGSNVNTATDLVLGGWGVSTLFVHTSGPFLNFGGMEQIGDPVLSNPSNEARFNKDAFRVLAPFTRRSNPWTFEGVTGPAFTNLDLTLSKEHPITEKVTFELRMESYNFLNGFNGANPSTDVNSPVFGRVVNQRGGYFGRQLQYSGKFRW